MTDSNKLQPLQSDPQRQADASFAGWEYQLWQSVYTWLKLGDEELLYLEGAEDFDRVGDEEAFPTQVKTSPGNITLRTNEIVDAIDHYWKLHKSQPDRNIIFRYLTRGNIGLEKGSPLGAGIKGLEYWKRCTNDVDSVGALRNFLIEEARLSTDLIQYLSKADAEDIQSTFIRKIEWITGARDTAFLIRQVEELLILHGNKKGVTAPESKKVASRLYTEASRTLANPKLRELSRAKFLEIFDTEIVITFSPSGLDALNLGARQTKKTESPKPHGFPTYTIGEYGAPTSLPPLPEKYSHRDNLCQELASILNQNGLICLTGSTSTGKTTLAKILATNSKREWLWMSFTGLASEQTRDRLDLMLATLDQTEHRNFILDDLELHGGSAKQFEFQLKMMIYALLQQHRYVIITSQKPLNVRVLTDLNLDKSVNQVVKPFDEEEVCDLCMTFECSDKVLAHHWSKIVVLKTSGHPTLVHAYLTHLNNENWPGIDQAAVFDLPVGVAKARRESQQLLTILTEDEKTLIYRLSILIGMFRRDHAIGIGEITPELSNPGTVFDSLVGPWLEVVSDDYFQISPLLNNTAEQVWSKDKIVSLNADIASAIITSGKLSQREVSAALMHGLIGKNAPVLASLIFSLLKTDEATFANFAHHIEWIVFYGTNPASPILKDDPETNYLIRTFQFFVACKVNSEQAAHLVEIWDAEIADSGTHSRSLPYWLAFCNLVLLREEVQVPPKTLLKYLGEIWTIERDIGEVGTSDFDVSSLLEEHGLLSDPEILEFYPRILLSRCNSKEFLLELLEGISGWEEDYRSRLASCYISNDKDSGIMITQCWRHESTKDNPDWLSCISIFEKTVEYALEWEIPPLAIAAARGIGIVKSDFLKDYDVSMHLMEKYIKRLGPSILLEDVMATTLYNQGDNESALEIWARFLPEWLEQAEDFDIDPMFSMRHSAVALGKLGDYDESAVSFMAACGHARKLVNNSYSIGLLADAGVAYWKAGDHLNALNALKGTLEELEKYEIETGDPAVYKINKVVGNTILCLTKTEEERSSLDIAEPEPGYCSNLDLDDRIRELPHSPLDVTWSLLAEYEFNTTRSESVFTRAFQSISEETSIYARENLQRLNIRHKIRSMNLYPIPDCLYALEVTLNAMREMRERRISEAVDLYPNVVYEKEITMGTSIGFGIPLGALISGIIQREPVIDLVTSWKETLAGQPHFELFQNWLGVMGDVLDCNEEEMITLLVVNGDDRDRKCLAAAILAVNGTIAPTVLLSAHLTLIDFAFNILSKIYQIDIGDILLELIEKQWIEKIQFRAILKNPMHTVPKIEAACKAEKRGFSKVALILLAVLPATSVNINAEHLSMIKEIADNNST